MYISGTMQVNMLREQTTYQHMNGVQNTNKRVWSFNNIVTTIIYIVLIWDHILHKIELNLQYTSSSTYPAGLVNTNQIYGTPTHILN